MKICDSIYRYPTGWRTDGLCRLRIFAGAERPGVLLTDLGAKNPSCAVEGAISYIVSQLMRDGRLVAEAKLFIQEEDLYSCWELELQNGRYRDWDTWRKMQAAEVAVCLGCEGKELLHKTGEDRRLSLEIERIRHEIDPYLGMGWPEDPSRARRRLEIWENHVPKDRLASLVEKGASEQELAKLLKRDLSLLADAFAFPEEEYIVFAEFLIGTGRVDFAVFSGRSWMKVTLIEIKGADFPLVTQSGYCKLSSRIEVARSQLQQRQIVLLKQYELFRRQFHALRERVQQGERPYQALLGPAGRLEVDPNKEVEVYYAVIGGRTVEDLRESEIRYVSEIPTPKIHIESWDTFLRKLRR